MSSYQAIMGLGCAFQLIKVDWRFLLSTSRTGFAAYYMVQINSSKRRLQENTFGVCRKRKDSAKVFCIRAHWQSSNSTRDNFNELSRDFNVLDYGRVKCISCACCKSLVLNMISLLNSVHFERMNVYSSGMHTTFVWNLIYAIVCMWTWDISHLSQLIRICSFIRADTRLQASITDKRPDWKNTKIWLCSCFLEAGALIEKEDQPLLPLQVHVFSIVPLSF